MNDAHEKQIDIAVAQAEVQLEGGFPECRIHVPASALLALKSEHNELIRFVSSIASQDYRGNSNPDRAPAEALLRRLGV